MRTDVFCKKKKISPFKTLAQILSMLGNVHVVCGVDRSGVTADNDVYCGQWVQHQKYVVYRSVWLGTYGQTGP